MRKLLQRNWVICLMFYCYSMVILGVEKLTSLAPETVLLTTVLSYLLCRECNILPPVADLVWGSLCITVSLNTTSTPIMARCSHHDVRTADSDMSPWCENSWYTMEHACIKCSVEWISQIKFIFYILCISECVCVCLFLSLSHSSEFLKKWAFE